VTRDIDDVARTARALASTFEVSEITIVGSQAILVHRADAMVALRNSPEIDAFVRIPGGAGPMGEEASHVINTNFGEGSAFHKEHGFFIDGVDESTAKLPPDWRSRAIERDVPDSSGGTVRIVAPAVADLVASKLVRGERKDISFAALCIASGLTNGKAVRASIMAAIPGDPKHALTCLKDATSNQAEHVAAAKRGPLPTKGPRNPLDDLDAVDAIKRMLDDRKSR